MIARTTVCMNLQTKKEKRKEIQELLLHLQRSFRSKSNGNY